MSEQELIHIVYQIGFQVACLVVLHWFLWGFLGRRQ